MWPNEYQKFDQGEESIARWIEESITAARIVDSMDEPRTRLVPGSPNPHFRHGPSVQFEERTTDCIFKYRK